MFEATGFCIFKLSNGEGSFPSDPLLFQPSLHMWYSWVALAVISAHVIFKSAGPQDLFVHYFYFEIESCYVIHAGLEPTTLLHYHPSARIVGMGHIVLHFDISCE